MANYYCDAAATDDAGAGTSTGTAKKTLAAGVALLGPGDTLFVKAGTYTLAAGVTIAGAQCGASRITPTIIEGYATTPGDRAGVPMITSATNSVNLLIYASGAATAYLELRSLKFTHAATTRGNGISGVTGAGSAIGACRLDSVEISGCAIGFSGGSRLGLLSADAFAIKGCTSGSISAIAASGGTVDLFDCEFSGNAGAGFNPGDGANYGGANFYRCRFLNNASAGMLNNQATRSLVYRFAGCTFAGNGGGGIKLTTTTGVASLFLRDSVIYGNSGGYGVEVSGAGTVAVAESINVAYGSNTSGPSIGLAFERGSRTLTVDPFANAAGGDYTPNATAGGGALIRGAGTGGADIGAIQHPGSGGSSGIVQLVSGGLVL